MQVGQLPEAGTHNMFKWNLEKHRKNKKVFAGIFCFLIITITTTTTVTAANTTTTTVTIMLLLMFLPTLAESLLSYNSLPVASFLNPIIFYSLLDSEPPVQTLLCFRTVLMIFLSSLNSEVQGRKHLVALLSLLQCRRLWGTERIQLLYFFSSQFWTFLAKLWEQDYAAAGAPQSEGRLSAFLFCTFPLADAWLGTLYVVWIKPQQTGLK